MRISNKKTIKKADAILTADWHLRDTQPKCRTDNYYETQFQKLKFIRDLQIQHGCPVLVAGDIFDISKPSPRLLTSTLHFMPKDLICISGQHDLPEHSLENFNQSGLAVLQESGKCKIQNSHGTLYSNMIINGYAYGEDLMEKRYKHLAKENTKKIAMIHTLIKTPEAAHDNIPYNFDYITAMKKLKSYNLIVSGDNHMPFVAYNGNQILVNPGSMMRMDADQINHKPRVYLWYADTNTVEPVYLPIEDDVVSRGHIEKKQEEDTRMEAYKERLKANIKIGISFEKNIERYINKNKVNNRVEKEVHSAMEEV